MKQDLEIGSGSPIATPYKWEAAPGRPKEEAPPIIEPWMSPLRLPPGVRKATKPLEFAFDGFEPDPPVSVEVQLAKKILKKLSRLRKKSMVAAACFTSEASRVIEQSGQLFPMEYLDRYYDSDAISRCSMSDPPWPGTPCSSTAVESSFSEPCSMRYTSVVVPSSACTSSARLSSCRFEPGDGPDELGIGSDGDKSLGGPRESAWHQPHDEVPTCVSQKWQMRRSYSGLIPELLRHSASSHSFKHLTLVRTFRRSKAAKQLDLEK